MEKIKFRILNWYTHKMLNISWKYFNKHFDNIWEKYPQIKNQMLEIRGDLFDLADTTALLSGIIKNKSLRNLVEKTLAKNGKLISK